MGLWPFTKKAKEPEKPKKKRHRRTRHEMMRDKLNDLKLHAELRRLEREIAEGDGGVGLSIGLDDLPELEKRLRSARLRIVPEDSMPEEHGAPAFLRDFLHSPAGEALASALGQGLMLRMQQPSAPTTTVSVTEAALPVAEIAEPDSSDPNIRGETPEQGETMTIMAGLIIGQLQDKTPEQAAQWLLSQERAEQFVELIMATDDDNIPAALSQLAQHGPDFAAVVGWLRTRPEWFIETVRNVRQLKQSPAPKRSGRKSQMGI